MNVFLYYLIEGVSFTNESKEIVSRGFFFAFTISGNFGYRGVFKRRSVVITAGRGTSRTREPLSISSFTIAYSNKKTKENNITEE